MDLDPLEEDLIRKRARQQFTDATDPRAGLTDEIGALYQEANPDPLAVDLAKKRQAKHAGTMADIERLKAEPDPASGMEILRAARRGVGTTLSDVGDAASFGLYRKGRNAVGNAVAPDATQEMLRGEEEFHALPGAKPVKALAEVAGYASPIGLPGAATKAGGAVAKAVGLGERPILGGALGGALTGGTVSAGESAVRGESPADIGAAGVRGMAMGGAAGAAGGAVTRAVGNAPERAAESELAGLAEGIRHKPKITKFEPNEAEFRKELAQAPELRALIKADPVTARPQVHARVDAVVGQDLDPVYHQMARAGVDRVPVQLAEDQLRAVRGSFNKVAEKSQIAVVDGIIEDLKAEAAQQGGTVPAQFLRETATAFQKQGHASLPMFGPIPLTKEVKQGVGNALRGAIGDHLEAIAPTNVSGKALRQAFEDANKRASLWLKMKDLVDEKAQYIGGHATPMAELVKEGVHAVRHPAMTALKLATGNLPDKLTRNVLGPAVGSQAGQALAPMGRAAVGTAPAMAGGAGSEALYEAAQKRKRDNEELIRMIQGGP